MNYETTENTGYCIPAEVRFYGISDVARMTGWSEKTVQKLFNDPKFPMTDFEEERSC